MLYFLYTFLLFLLLLLFSYYLSGVKFSLLRRKINERNYYVMLLPIYLLLSTFNLEIL